MIRIARRRLLQAMLALLAGAGLPATPRAAAAAPAAFPGAWNGRSVRAVGRAYLESHPDDALSGLDASGSDDPLSGLDARWTDADPERLRRDIAADFARGDVVWVRGWLLARSEARYCARRARAC